MRILILANCGMGLFKFRKELIQNFLDQNEVIIALPYDEFVDSLKELGCNYVNVKMERRGMNPFKDLKLFFDYIKLLRKEKPDVVLTYTIKPTLYGGVACRIANKKYIVNITGLGTALEKDGLLKNGLLRLYKISIAKAHCVFFQNQSNMDFFYRNSLVRKGKCKLIPGSGVNLQKNKFEKYPMTETDHDSFLFVGRLMKDKGIEELFSAAKIIKKRFPNVSFNIVGGMDEDYSNEINELSDVIHYFGQQKDVHSFMKQCNAVILPSYHEGMANVLLEAASTGRPVIASKIPGCQETFDEGVSGLGITPKNSDDLVRAITQFIEMDYETKRAMGIAGRKKMEKNFDRQIVIEAYKKQLEILGGNENESVRKNQKQ